MNQKRGRSASLGPRWKLWSSRSLAKASQKQLALGQGECNLDLVVNGWKIRAFVDTKNARKGERAIIQGQK